MTHLELKSSSCSAVSSLSQQPKENVLLRFNNVRTAATHMVLFHTDNFRNDTDWGATARGWLFRRGIKWNKNTKGSWIQGSGSLSFYILNITCWCVALQHILCVPEAWNHTVMCLGPEGKDVFWYDANLNCRGGTAALTSNRKTDRFVPRGNLNPLEHLSYNMRQV